MEKLETDKRLLQQKLEQPDQSINSNHTVRILLTNFFQIYSSSEYLRLCKKI